jgi:hypothetical protein
MSDISKKLFIVHKLRQGKKNKLMNRRLYDIDQLPQALEQAQKLANEKGEDFFVVMVVGEALKPENPINEED